MIRDDLDSPRKIRSQAAVPRTFIQTKSSRSSHSLGEHHLVIKNSQTNQLRGGGWLFRVTA
jgi:hypothetical protein